MKEKVGKHKASNVTIVDSGDYYTGTEVEAVLQEIGLVAADDGTYIKVSSGGTDLFRVRKSDGQFQVAGGFDSDTPL